MRNSCYLEIMKKNPRIGWYIFLAVLLIQISHPVALVADSTAEVSKISVTETEKRMHHPDVVIIDVRKQKSWWRSTTKIHGAVREDPANISQWIDKYSKTKTLILYCD